LALHVELGIGQFEADKHCWQIPVDVLQVRSGLIVQSLLLLQVCLIQLLFPSHTFPVGQSALVKHVTQIPLGPHFGCALGHPASELHPVVVGLVITKNIIITTMIITIDRVIRRTGIHALDLGS
jgi:hypothetical protein